jgi:DNA-binding MarR family transcriptional regulator
MHVNMAAELDPAEIRACAQSCAAANVRRAARAVGRLYAESFAEVGLEPTQYSLLVACTLAEGATVGKLAEIFLLERSALARNLAVMEKRGLLRVKPGEDRRTRKVSLTAKGRTTLAAALPRWREAQAKAEKAFGAERLAQLVGESRALADAMRKMDDGRAIG